MREELGPAARFPLTPRFASSLISTANAFRGPFGEAGRGLIHGRSSSNQLSLYIYFTPRLHEVPGFCRPPCDLLSNVQSAAGNHYIFSKFTSQIDHKKRPIPRKNVTSRSLRFLVRKPNSTTSTKNQRQARILRIFRPSKFTTDLPLTACALDIQRRNRAKTLRETPPSLALFSQGQPPPLSGRPQAVRARLGGTRGGGSRNSTGNPLPVFSRAQARNALPSVKMEEGSIFARITPLVQDWNLDHLASSLRTATSQKGPTIGENGGGGVFSRLLSQDGHKPERPYHR